MLAAVEQVVETFAEWKARLRFSFQAKTWSAFPVSGSKHERNVHFVIAFKGRIIVLYCVPLGEKKKKNFGAVLSAYVQEEGIKKCHHA